MNKIMVQAAQRPSSKNNVPMETTRTGDTFKCPKCTDNVPIRYVRYPHGIFEDIGLICPSCKREYSILF